MLRFRQLHRLVPRGRRCLAALPALLGYVVAAVGGPAAAPVFKDASRPFPCQFHACGCQTAEQCWAACCCYSPQEKQAWAAAHHVDVPPAPPPADAGWHEPRLRDHAGTGCSCCPPAAVADTCCSPEPPADAPAATCVPGLRACPCQPGGHLWLTAHPTLPPPPPTDWRYDPSAAGWLCLLSDGVARLVSSPPTPPPRG
jgi:hypothetical protein